MNGSTFRFLRNSTETMRMYVADFALDPTLADSEIPTPLKGAIGETAMTDRQTKTFDRAELMALGSPLVDRMLQAGIRSACCVPWITPKGLTGSFTVASTKGESSTFDDVDFLKLIAMQLANAVDNSPANAEAASRDRRFSAGSLSLNLGLDVQYNPLAGEIVGESTALRGVLNQAKKVAINDTTVLLLGETGTGKDLIARAIHRMSLRKDAPFIKLNCAAIPGGLLESELFGHEKGAFTGAFTQKAGRIEQADSGTLFLDEVGELPLELQPKLLRVLQEQEFERLGGNRTIRVDIRLVAATNRDLSASMVKRAFRADLYYRLNVFPIRMPSLKERVQDIPALVRYFTQKFARKMNKKIDTISAEAMQAMIAWDWPGNIRELENYIERAVIFSEGSTLNASVSELLRK